MDRKIKSFDDKFTKAEKKTKIERHIDSRENTDKLINEGVVTKTAKKLDQNPDDIEALLKRGKAFLILGDNKKAVEDFTKVIELEPGNGDAFFLRGSSFSNLGRMGQTIADYIKVIELGPKSTSRYAKAYHNVGSLYAMVHDNEKAVQHLKKAIELDPDSSSSYHILGQVYRTLGGDNIFEAAKNFYKAVDLNPKDPLFLYDKTITTIQMSENGLIKQSEEEVRSIVIRDLTKVLELDPKFKDAYVERALLYNEEGNFEKVLADVSEAIKLDPKDPKLQEMKIQIIKVLGMPEDT